MREYISCERIHRPIKNREDKMTIYEKLEWLHCQIQELQNGNELTDHDLLLMLEFVEDIREPYLIERGETKND